MLVDVAHRLQATLDVGDTVARMGGDEFVILMTGMGAMEACRQACRRVLDVLQQPMMVGADAVNLSASMGVALFPRTTPMPTHCCAMLIRPCMWPSRREKLLPPV